MRTEINKIENRKQRSQSNKNLALENINKINELLTKQSREKKTKAEIINIRNERGAITMDLTDIKKKKYEKFYVNEIDT